MPKPIQQPKVETYWPGADWYSNEVANPVVSTVLVITAALESGFYEGWASNAMFGAVKDTWV